MGDKTAIEWTDATWNPVTGCSVVSPGCTNCYAMKVAHRFRAQEGSPYFELTLADKAVWDGNVHFNERALALPLRWKRPRRIFVNSMGDLFHDSVPDAWIDRVFAVMALAPQHTFQLLTKRAERMRDYLLDRDASYERVLHEALSGDYPSLDPGPASDNFNSWLATGFLPNVWLGVSAEDQKRADERIPLLLATPAAMRFVSCEPLLGPVRLDRIEESIDTFADCGGHPDPHWPDDTQDAHWLDALRGHWDAEARAPDGARRGDIDVGLIHEGGKIDWVIAGGESGRDARPMHPDWARALRDQCAAAGVPFFFKQWGEWAPQVGAVDGWCIDDNPEISRFDHRDWEGDHWGESYRPMWCDDVDDDTVSRLGKKRAGALLDGVAHKAFPE